MPETCKMLWQTDCADAVFDRLCLDDVLDGIQWYAEEIGCTPEVAWLCWVCGDFNVTVADHWEQPRPVAFAVLPADVVKRRNLWSRSAL